MNSIQPEHINRHKGSIFTLCTFFFLYIAQAVPSSFLSTALQVLMRENNSTIGLLQLVKLPWIIKFLWAPMVDRRCVTVNDYKRTIIVSELVYAALLLTIGFLHVSTDIYFIIFLVVLSLVTSGTQDVATDALAVLTFKKSDKSMVNSMQSMGSFGGALLGGGVLLMALHRYGWQTVLPFLAIFVLIALLPLLFNKYLTINEKPKETKAKKADFIWFFTQKGIWKQIVFLVIYYAGIFGTLSLLRSFLVDHGYNMKEIGLISGVLGTGVAFFASWGAGFFVRKYGVFKARIAFACIILITTLYFFLMLSDTITTLSSFMGNLRHVHHSGVCFVDGKGSTWQRRNRLYHSNSYHTPQRNDDGCSLRSHCSALWLPSFLCHRDCYCVSISCLYSLSFQTKGNK